MTSEVLLDTALQQRHSVIHNTTITCTQCTFDTVDYCKLAQHLLVPHTAATPEESTQHNNVNNEEIIIISRAPITPTNVNIIQLLLCV